MRPQHCPFLWTIIVAVALTCIFAHSSADAQVSAPAASVRLGQRVATAHERIGPSVVLVEGFVRRKNPRPRWKITGVIVTADGLVLCGATGQVDRFEVLLSDGRRSKGRLVGWSGEWDIALLRIDGAGPWPFTRLGETTGVKPGQLVMAYDNRFHARLEIVDRAVPARWFGTTWANSSISSGGEVLFDLNGKMVGLGNTRNADARLYADIKVVQSMWEDLVAGKDADRERLWTEAQRGEDIKFFMPGTPVTEVVRARASAATVRMRDAAKTNKRELWSGVIVNREGLIVTCAHHEKMPGTRLSISLMDGRTVPGIIRGVNPITDVGIVEITEPGTWPYVELGDSRRLRPGAHCVNVGYPMDFEAGRPPQVGAGVVIPPSNMMFVAGSYALHAKMVPETMGGMSGGGVFDPDGRLVAINGAGNDLDGEMFRRIEVARSRWDGLSHEEYLVLKGPPETEEAYGELRRAAEPTRRSVVTILDGKKPVAIGAIVARDGQILTRAHALPNAPSCRLADGRVMSAEIIRKSSALGLALLKVSADGLHEVDRWSSKDPPSFGHLLALPDPGEATMVGSVTCGAHQIRPVTEGNDDNSLHHGFPRAYEIGVVSNPKLTGGPVVDAEGQLRGFVVAASDGSLIVVPSSVGRRFLVD
jgi:S1-C subfamily serine protease